PGRRQRVGGMGGAHPRLLEPETGCAGRSAEEGSAMKGEIVAESAVRFVRALPAPPARVWEFLTDCARLPEWFGEGVIEPREGGAVSLMGGHVRGVVTAWRPEKLLGYTWNVFSPRDAESKWPVSYLEFHLDGSTLKLMHRPVPAAMQAQTMMGWHTMLDLIEA